jgi:hypothetical protein
MWVIFRDPQTPFMHVDKFVTQLVEDKDILAYQEVLHATYGGRKFELNLDAYFSQQFVTTAEDVEYFARKYNAWVDVKESLSS